MERPRCFNPSETGSSAEVSRYALELEHKIATLSSQNARLRTALTFCADRLVYVYKESPNVNFILTARRALEEG